MYVRSSSSMKEQVSRKEGIKFNTYPYIYTYAHYKRLKSQEQCFLLLFFSFFPPCFEESTSQHLINISTSQDDTAWWLP